MRSINASFSLRLFEPSDANRSELDQALHIYCENTSPLLRTSTNQIRYKIAAPNFPEGTFHFAALFKGKAIVGFAMFGHYPRKRLLIIDHLVIDRQNRKDGAFYTFSQLIVDAVAALRLAVDFTVVEIERNLEFGGHQTGGRELARLLGQIGFGEVHAEYVIANTEANSYAARYRGILMLHGAEKIHSIRREDLLRIYEGVLFDHYLPWYRDFFGADIESYGTYLKVLHSEFAARLEADVILVNGPVADILQHDVRPAIERSSEAKLGISVGLFLVIAVPSITALAYFQIAPTTFIAVMIALLAIFAGVAMIGIGKASDVFEVAISMLPGGRRRSRYLPTPQPKAVGKGKGRGGRNG